MYKNYEDFVSKFFGKNETKVKFICAGVGYNLAKIMSVPGASKVLDSMRFLYSEDSLNDYIGESVEKSVCLDTAIKLTNFKPDIGKISVGITGAITTNRYRKGSNEAFISIRDNKNNLSNYHILLPKLDEESYKLRSVNPVNIQVLREWEDNVISMTALQLLEPNIPWMFPDNAKLTELK